MTSRTGELLTILDELDILISTARTMPMSALVIVHREEALDLIERARAAVPTSVREAQSVLDEATDRVAQGQAEAERIVRRAQDEAEQLIASENVVRNATQRADLIVEAAEAQAAQLRAGADDYCDKVLAGLESELARVGDQVRAGREVLASRIGETAAPQAQPAVVEEPRRRAVWSVDPLRHPLSRPGRPRGRRDAVHSVPQAPATRQDVPQEDT